MKIDVQCHVFPEVYRDILLNNDLKFPTATKKGEDIILDYDGKQKFLISNEKYNPANIIKGMDECGIDAAIISCNLPDVCLLPSDICVKAAQLINDAIMDLCLKYTGRFFGIASIPWNVPDEAMKEVRRVKEKGFKGVMVFSHAGEWQVDDERIKSVYDLCGELNLPLTIHPTVPLWYECAGNYSLIPMLSFQMDSSLALMRLILSGIIEGNEKIKVVMPHAGGVLPYMEGRIKYQTEVMKRGVDKIKTPVPEQLRKGRIWYDTVSPSKESLDYLHNYVSCDKIMFGTDFPFINTKYFIELVSSSGFSEEELEKIFWKNANDVYELGL